MGWDLLLFEATTGGEQETGMAKTADRRAVAVDCIQLAVVALGESGHVIKEDARVPRTV